MMMTEFARFIMTRRRMTNLVTPCAWKLPRSSPKNCSLLKLAVLWILPKWCKILLHELCVNLLVMDIFNANGNLAVSLEARKMACSLCLYPVLYQLAHFEFLIICLLLRDGLWLRMSRRV